MKNEITNLLMFVAGAAVGTVVTWKVVKTKYERKADEEIKSMQEYYEGRVKSEQNEPKAVEPEEPKVEPDPDEEERVEYSNMVKELGYSNEEGGPVNVGLKPYVIAPDEFGELEHYQQITLFYHSDGILVDEDEEVIDDIDETIGVESLKHFGEYEDDSVFVRNDRTRTDYEILLDESKFYPERPAVPEDE